MDRSNMWAITAAVVAIALSGCGGDADTVDDPTSPAGTATTATSGPTTGASDDDLNTALVTIGDETFEFVGEGGSIAVDWCQISESQGFALGLLPRTAAGEAIRFDLDLSADNEQLAIMSADETVNWDVGALGGEVDSWEISGDTVSGSAMFKDLVNLSDELVPGTFTVTCP